MTFGYQQLQQIQHLPEEGLLFAVITFNNVPFHAVFVQVKVVDDVQIPVSENSASLAWAYYKSILNLNDNFLFTVQLPNYDGDWVMVIYPFAE